MTTLKPCNNISLSFLQHQVSFSVNTCPFVRYPYSLQPYLSLFCHQYAHRIVTFNSTITSWWCSLLSLISCTIEKFAQHRFEFRLPRLGHLRVKERFFPTVSLVLFRFVVNRMSLHYEPTGSTLRITACPNDGRDSRPTATLLQVGNTQALIFIG